MKLIYRNSCRDAAKLIASYTSTDSNYQITRRLLHERHENKRCREQALLKAVWMHLGMKTESAVGLRKVLETVFFIEANFFG